MTHAQRHQEFRRAENGESMRFLMMGSLLLTIRSSYYKVTSINDIRFLREYRRDYGPGYQGFSRPIRRGTGIS